ncbi:MAG: 50S ribosomal protein L4 [Thermoguttaceae bacterium]|nr:50S ribosomal protein L4 [Thermoguttaceae bacterium]
MASLTIYDKTGAQVGTLDVDTDAMAPKISKQLLHDAVVMYQANRRQGSVKTKSRGEVSGSRKKMYRQKGTGNARAGHKRSGVRRGGGHIFSLSPRDWTYRLPSKSLRAATRMAMASKIGADAVKIIDALTFEAPKTTEVAAILKNLSIASSLLIVTESVNDNVYKSARNLPRVSVLPVSDLNALEILKPKEVLLTKSAMEKFINPSAAE